MSEPVHRYRVTVKDGRNNQVYNVSSERNIEQYQAGLLSGMYGIVTASTPIGVSIHVTDENLVGIEEIDGDVAAGPAEVGDDEQENRS